MGKYDHRKATSLVRFTDKNGVPLAGKEISVTQLSHDFLFGCGAIDALHMVSGSTSKLDAFCGKGCGENDFFSDRMDKWLKLFNYGTLHFYWGTFETKEGHPNTENLMKAARFLQSHNIKIKGHPLCWHTVCADWLMKYDDATILSKQLDRIAREVSDFKGVIDYWDVINEVVIMPVYDRYDNAITRICKDLGRVRLVKEVFEAAKSANPDAKLLINDFNLSESYRILIDGCLNAGVPISAIGIQTHQHQGYMGREKLEDILERYSFFNLPLHFTENTFVSGHLMPPDIVDLNDYQIPEWPSTPEGEERQRENWKEMYEILFAHPLVEAVTGWDFADGGWLKAPSGIIRADNTIKPAYSELDRMINDEWHTECKVITNDEGIAEITGFCGNYQLTCEGKSLEYKLSKNESSGTVMF